uniref:Uncharacterized protein n=1 Tax=Parascaris equorum TaxID=6256 RepID=A0A914S6N3_PAREQ
MPNKTFVETAESRTLDCLKKFNARRKLKVSVCHSVCACDREFVE